MRGESRMTRQKHARGRERPHFAVIRSGQIPSGFGVAPGHGLSSVEGSVAVLAASSRTSFWYESVTPVVTGLSQVL